MTVALALIEPILAGLAALPVAGMWYVLHSHGQLGQRLRDLDAVHGFAGRVSRSLDPSEVAETAVSDFVDLMRAESAALVRFGDDGTATVHASGPVPFRLPERRDRADEWSLVPGRRTDPAGRLGQAAACRQRRPARVGEDDRGADHDRGRSDRAARDPRARDPGVPLQRPGPGAGAGSHRAAGDESQEEHAPRADRVRGPSRRADRSAGAHAVRVDRRRRRARPAGGRGRLRADARSRPLQRGQRHARASRRRRSPGAVRDAHVGAAPARRCARPPRRRRVRDPVPASRRRCRGRVRPHVRTGRQRAGHARRSRDRGHRQRRRRPDHPARRRRPAADAAGRHRDVQRQVAAHRRRALPRRDRPPHAGPAVDARRPAFGDRERRTRRRLPTEARSRHGARRRRRGARAMGAPVPRCRGTDRVRARRRGHGPDQGADRSGARPRHRDVAQVRRARPRPRLGGQSLDPRPVRLAPAGTGQALSRRQRRAAERARRWRSPSRRCSSTRRAPVARSTTCTGSACGWRSTTSARGTRRSRTCGACPCTSSRSTSRS